MKILYGVCGEGFGHSSRAKRVVPFLEKLGHEILIITYGQAYKILKNFNIIKIEGVKLFFQDGKMSLSKTFSGNLEGMIKNAKNFSQVYKSVKEFNPDVCISDMELLTPIISHHLKTPLISFDNQHRLTNLDLEVPKEYKLDYFIAKTAVNRVVSKAKAFIILSFTKPKKKSKDSFVVSPILREEIIKLKPKKKNYVLVYLTKKNRKLIKILKSINENFIVYGHNKDKVSKNLKFRKAGPHFIQDLKDCKAIIATAGFTLMSEALYLKKPYYALPLGGQFEQTLNALFLKEAYFGEFSEKPSKEELEKFLHSLSFYEKKLRNHKTNPEEALDVLRKVLSKIKS